MTPTLVLGPIRVNRVLGLPTSTHRDPEGKNNRELRALGPIYDIKHAQIVTIQMTGTYPRTR